MLRLTLAPTNPPNDRDARRGVADTTTPFPMTFRLAASDALARAAAVLIAAIVACAPCQAQTGDPDAPPDTVVVAAPRDPDLISLGIEFIPTPGTGSFFENYRNLGGSVDALSARTMPTLTLRLSTSGSLRTFVSLGITGTSFTDVYGVTDSASPRGSAALVEQFSASAVPVIAGLEYSPVRTQFTTYIGAGVGASFNTAEWQTTVRSNTISSYARPSLNTRGGGFGVAAKVYTGIDLRFDGKHGRESTIRGIYMEGSYLFLPLIRDYFASVRAQGRGVPNPPENDGGLLNLGGFTFTVGLNLQFVRR